MAPHDGWDPLNFNFLYANELKCTHDRVFDRAIWRSILPTVNIK